MSHHGQDCKKYAPIRQLCLFLGIAVSITGSNGFFVPSQIHSKRKRIQTCMSAISNETPRRTNQQQQRTTTSSNTQKKPSNGHHQPNRRNNNSSSKKYDTNMAQAFALNKKLTECPDSTAILQLLANTPNALTKMAGGGALNSVNFSTALHRMAKQTKDRKSTLTNPRFALFLCSLAEAMAGMDYTTTSLGDWTANKDDNDSSSTSSSSSLNDESSKASTTRIAFNSRECSNIAWAIAKLRMAPPQSALPVSLTNVDLVETSLQLRLKILKAKKSGESATALYIPTLSLLAGKLLDCIMQKILNSQKTFNTQEMANLLWALATAQRADPRVFAHISKSLIQTFDHDMSSKPKPQELSNSIWAFATSQITGQGQEIMVNYIASTLTLDFVQQFKAQELSNTAWGLATILSNKDTSERSTEEDANVLSILRQIAVAITKRADEFKSQELSNTAWAFATCGFGLSGTNSDIHSNDYIYLQSDDLAGDYQLMSNALDAIASSALPRLRVFQSQELNNLAWAFCRLGRTDCTYLYDGIGRELGQKRRHVITGQDIGTTLWSFATLEYFDQDIYVDIVSKLTMDRASSFNPQELSNSVWALATAGVEVKYPDAFDTTLVPTKLRPSDWRDDPVTMCFAATANELMRRPHQFKPQEIKDVMWSFSKAGIRHPKLFKAVAEHLVGSASDVVPEGKLHCGRGLNDFSPQGIGNLAWSYAKQAQLAVDTVNRVEGLSFESSGRLFIYSTVCIDIGETLMKRLFNACAVADITNHDNLAKLKPQDMSNTAWSFAVLGLRHTPFFEAVSHQVVERLNRDRGASGVAGFGSQELANIVWACATLNCRFPEILDAIATYMYQLCDQGRDARSIAHHFKRQELANIAWSCAVMGHYPPILMKLLYAGLVGRADEKEDRNMLGQIFGDGGLQRQAIMSLLYVQMASDLESPNSNTSDLTLPPNFPDGWNLVGDFDASPCDSTMDSFSMLTLSTSKIQKDVSNALDRIGFNHVQEHVISMDELVQKHGVQLSSNKPSFEILSIDIANVDRKIGLEVDGPGHFISVLDTWSPQESNRGYVKNHNNGGKLEYQFQWDDRQQMNGSTALKERLLKRLGWKIFHIPFWEWYAIQGDTAKEDEYCRQLVSKILS